MTNTVRHGHANPDEPSFFEDEEDCLIELQDNRVGFENLDPMTLWAQADDRTILS